jgi:hypothetical protein
VVFCNPFVTQQSTLLTELSSKSFRDAAKQPCPLQDSLI